MDWFHTPTEIDDIKELSNVNSTLKGALKKDYTDVLFKDLNMRLYGAIPRNWVVNIQGLIGTPTGVFKTSLGIKIAMTLDKSFTPEERMGFTANEVNDKISEYATKKQVFMLDEQVHDLKMSAINRLANIIESCREQQLCFILCGVPKETLTFSSWLLERFDESDDKYLPKKRVRYLVKNPLNNLYRGHIKVDIPPLTNPKWRNIWDRYMIMKTEHQEKVKKQQITGFNFEIHAEDIKKNIKDFEVMKKDGLMRLYKQKVKNYIYKKFPDITNEERHLIYDEICFWYEKKKNEM